MEPAALEAGDMAAVIKRKADFEGCTKKTMDGLKKVVGITPEKSHKNKDMER
jgi:hypothetical protein